MIGATKQHAILQFNITKNVK